jgi:hypothetical protein
MGGAKSVGAANSVSYGGRNLEGREERFKSVPLVHSLVS